MATKTSQSLRDNIDKYLNATYWDDGYSHYLCDVLMIAENLPKREEIASEFIDPEVNGGWDLFTKNYIDRYLVGTMYLGYDEYAERQLIRFTLAEFIACHYESIGD